MTPLEYLQNKHAEIKNKLKEAAQRKFPKGETVTCCDVIGKTLDVAGQTVYNYVSGNIKDGYLAEAILKEIRQIKYK